MNNTTFRAVKITNLNAAFAASRNLGIAAVAAFKQKIYKAERIIFPIHFYPDKCMKMSGLVKAA